MPEQRLEDAWLPLRESRAELVSALNLALPHRDSEEERHDGFPRSRLFRSLLHHKGSLSLVALVLAFALRNPRLVRQLARRVPVRLLASRLFPLLR
jgi:hypothetical protein